jgi:hypothetical protein
MKFNRKGTGRIYTDKEENIEKIENIIKEMDEFEFEYLPKDLIAVFDGKVKCVYNYKFDELDLSELCQRCWNSGIYVFCIVGE